MARAATVKMTCGHTNLYFSPWPPEGEVGWCHRCAEFRNVVHVKPRSSIEEAETGYHKDPQITHCYYNAPRWYD